MNIPELLEALKTYGISVTVNGDRIRLVPGSRVPLDLAEVVREHKAEVMNYLLRQETCPPMPSYTYDPKECWPLQEWRRVSIPDWRRILHEAIDRKNAGREEYARWMLREILLDPEYQEPES